MTLHPLERARSNGCNHIPKQLYNFKQICQIGNTALISPDILGRSKANKIAPSKELTHKEKNPDYLRPEPCRSCFRRNRNQYCWRLSLRLLLQLLQQLCPCCSFRRSQRFENFYIHIHQHNYPAWLWWLFQRFEFEYCFLLLPLLVVTAV